MEHHTDLAVSAELKTSESEFLDIVKLYYKDTLEVKEKEEEHKVEIYTAPPRYYNDDKSYMMVIIACILIGFFIL